MAEVDPAATRPATASRAADVGAYGVVLAVAVYVLLRGLGSFGLWDPWEPLHAESAREMAGRGWLAGAPEPPLCPWGIRVGTALWGRTELGVRIVGALAAVASMLAVCYAVGRWAGRRAGVFAALVLGTSPLFYFLARQATADIYVATTAGTSLLFFCLALFQRDGRRLWHCAIGGAGFALALLSRAPVVAAAVVVAPLLAFGLARAGGGRPDVAAARDPRFAKIALAVLLGSIVVAGSWYATALAQHHDLSLLTAVQPAPAVEDQPGGFDYYLRGFIFGFFPWSCLLPVALALLASGWARDPADRGLEICLALSCLLTFVVINLPKDRFPQALAPVAIPIATLIGIALDRLLGSVSAAGTRLAWGVAAMLYLPPMIDVWRQQGLRYLLGSFTTVRDVPKTFFPGNLFMGLLGAMALILLLSIVVRSRILAGAFLAAAVALAGHNAATVVPALTPEKSVKDIFEAWRQVDSGTAPVGFFGELTPGVTFYAGPRLRPIVDAQAFMTHMNPEQPAFTVIAKEKLLAVDLPYRKRFPGQRLYVVARHGSDYILIANRDPGVKSPR